jgi:RNA recognition motif-containing protein
MQNKIYVGNLAYGTTSDDLNQLFSQYGTVIDAKVISDKHTGRSKGFGFVTFEADEAAQKALVVNETEFQGRNLRVNIAREEERRERSSGGDKRW